MANPKAICPKCERTVATVDEVPSDPKTFILFGKHTAKAGAVRSCPMSYRRTRLQDMVVIPGRWIAAMNASALAQLEAKKAGR